MAGRRAPDRASALRRLRRGVPAVLSLALLTLGLSGPALDPAAASVAAPGPVQASPASLSAASQTALAAAPSDPVGRLPAVGLVPRATAPATSAAPAPAAPASTPPADPDGSEATAAPPAADPEGSTLPLPVEPPGSQVVTVVAASSSSTSAQLTAWQLGDDGWTAVLGPVTARVGSAGVGRASEGSARTPAGTFGLTEAFGRAGDPGTALPYRVVDGDDWWVSDPASPRYNQYAECAPGSCDFDEAAGENLAAAGAVYDSAVVIDYNRGGTPGAGSAFFLHVTNGAPTAGCVAIDRGSVQALLRWLDPGAAPVVSIGVG
jgi:L,D-peptidoglycan transpeptidase YkuD (ErfK/YbiS/YcfS/YnhG family)